MEITKSAMIAIVGRPNVGKSTLTNRFAGEKVAIVTPKPQTTRNRIMAVRNHGEGQLVFVDTPGFHLARTKLGEYMNRVVGRSVVDVDAVLLVVEPVANVGTPEELLIESIRKSGVPAVLAVNKTDTLKSPERILEVIGAYAERHAFDACVPVSAATGEGVEALLGVLENYLEESPPLFPEGMTSDQPERQVLAEIVREKLLMALEREIPHGTAVEVTQFSEREDGLMDVGVTIYCEKESHKGIIIGKRGVKLKEIGAAARADMERFLGAKVYLETWVKVREGWRDKESAIRNFGYE